MPEHTDDLRFVRRLRFGDEAAFAELCERHVPAVYRFALSRLGDREDAREITQGTTAKALEKLASYRGEASLLTWLCAICHNEVLMLRRRERRAPFEVEVDDGALERADGRGATGVAGPGGPEAAVLRRERSVRVHMVLDALPEHYARALEWKYLEQLPVREIAERLGLGPKAAESVLSRARRAFRETHERLELVAGAGDGEPRREVRGHV